MMSALLIILALAVLLALLEGLARATWTLQDDRPQKLTVTTSDGWTLAVWYRPARERRFEEPVVLCHGLGNNAAMMDFSRPWSLAASLSEVGFDCYSVDLRGAGESVPPDDGLWDFDVDTHIERDAPAVVELVRRHSRAARVWWVGHSLGGLIGLAGAGTSLSGQVAGVVTMGSPVFFERRTLLTRLTRAGTLLAPAGRFPADFFCRVGAPLSGWFEVHAPTGGTNLKNIALQAQRALLTNIFAPIWRGVLGQLTDWIDTGRFCSRDGQVDYREGARRLALPVLVVGGVCDHLAPLAVTREYFSMLTSPDKELALFGKNFGQREDYGHGDLVVGKNAEVEVYPVVRGFLMRRSRAWAAGVTSSAVAAAPQLAP